MTIEDRAEILGENETEGLRHESSAAREKREQERRGVSLLRGIRKASRALMLLVGGASVGVGVKRAGEELVGKKFEREHPHEYYDGALYAEAVEKIKDIYGDTYEVSIATVLDTLLSSGHEQQDKQIAQSGLRIETPLISSQERDTVSAEELQSVLSDIFPRTWLKNVNSIRQVSFEDSIGPVGSDSSNSGWKTVARATLQKDRKRTNITFYNLSKSQTTGANLNFIVHEIGHANDWRRDIMSPLEKAQLLLEVTARLDASDRYMSSYVESRKSKDETDEKYIKAEEYWAEIAAVYFTNPGALPLKDFEIVDARVTRTDPSFDLGKATHTVNKFVTLHQSKSVP